MVKIMNSWKITLVDTGENTNTGGRLKRVSKYVKNEEAFVLHMVMEFQILIFPL